MTRDLFPTVWDPEKRRYVICEMRSWGFDHPVAEEVILRCGVEEHPEVRAHLMTHGAEQRGWARILGDGQSITEAQHSPRLLCVQVEDPDVRKDLQRWARQRELLCTAL